MKNNYIIRMVSKYSLRAVFLTVCFLSVTMISISAQGGLEGVIVEKYYVSDAADALEPYGGTLPAGSVTYRVFADLKTGYKIQAVIGNEPSPIILKTTTLFFNNSDRGNGTGENIQSFFISSGTTALDSYLSMGASSSGHIAVPKNLDTDGSILGTGDYLKNDDEYAGIPLTVADGFIEGTPFSITAVGINPNDWFGAFAGFTGPELKTSDGAYSSLVGAEGPTEENLVMVGQFTTDGEFTMELNFQLLSPTGLPEKYVARNADTTKISVFEFPALLNTYAKDIVHPEISITSPTDGTIAGPGSLEITVNASDGDGQIDSVEYYLGYRKIGVSKISPFSFNWNAKVGIHNITAVANDNDGARTVSEPITVAITTSNLPPTVSITAPTDGSIFVPAEEITIQAVAEDDGQIDSVRFFVNDVLIATDTESPYETTWQAVEGEAILKAVATDNNRVSRDSELVTITVSSNPNSSNALSPEPALSVYPIPAEKILHIKLGNMKGNGGAVKYAIIDITGAIVMTDQIHGDQVSASHSIDITNLESGYYFIRISANEEVQTLKFLKLRQE